MSLGQAAQAMAIAGVPKLQSSLKMSAAGYSGTGALFI
jgi:hypothetical protein